MLAGVFDHLPELAVKRHELRLVGSEVRFIRLGVIGIKLTKCIENFPGNFNGV